MATGGAGQSFGVYFNSDDSFVTFEGWIVEGILEICQWSV